MSGNQRLPVLVNTETNERVTLEKAVMIGRAPENEIVLPDDGYVSAEHAKIFWENGWWIEDVNSSNGTYVNDELVSGRRKLAPNDLIKIGRTIFTIE
ncbi:MAG: FHA domain-containing protein [Cyanobacteria bacterium]|nr:FHA domain-containing protein [Cyanobacteriota bacterium]